MTNSAQMSLEERLVQQIKETALGPLVGDEDALTKLVERAVREATVQPTRVPKQWGGFEEKDSPAVAAAREVSKRAAERVADKIVEEMLADDDHAAAMRAFVIAAMPDALLQAVSKRLYETHFGVQANANAVQQLAGKLGVALGP